MTEQLNFIKHFECSVKEYWDSIAITEYKKLDKSYAEVATDIEKLHYIWSNIGLGKGDKIGICANSCCEWVEIFMAAVTGGYVAVILQPNTSSDIIKKLANHSDCKILYLDSNLADSHNIISQCIVVDIQHSINITSQIPFPEYLYHAKQFSKNNPYGIDKTSFNYLEREPDDICTIIYTSGSTGIPKGAMLSVKYFDANSKKLLSRYKHQAGDSDICINPVYHIFALGGDVLASLVSGMRLILLPKPTPAQILDSLYEHKPHKIFAVPLFLYKILEMSVGPEFFNAIEKGDSSVFEKSPESYLEKKNLMMRYLGGNIEVFLTGGVSISSNIERFLIEKLNFPLAIVYGMTESGPVSYGIIGQHKLRSAGRIVNENKIRIHSEDPLCIPGEIQIKDNLFSGYFKDPQNTKSAFTEDGWLHSGDMGLIDHSGNLFITGRCKDILVLPSGENIYPEDIESALNNSPYILESLLYQKNEKLYALIFPDYKTANENGLDSNGLYCKISNAVRKANMGIPGYTIISSFKLLTEPLEKTAKGSIKRFLYTEE